VTGALIGLAAGMALLLWIVRRAGAPRRLAAEIDEEELEAAEREVRDLDPGVHPDDDQPGDDWGPGAGHPEPR
jgi:predicted RNA methylase